MIYTKKELLSNGETHYSIRCLVKKNKLYVVEHGIYSDEEEPLIDETYICKKYEHGVLTGLSAFYIYDLTDQIPTKYYLATVQHSFPIRRNNIIQTYQEPNIFNVGLTQMKYGRGNINIYDLERLLIELIRLKEKYPSELYYEVINNFRRIKDKIDFYKVNQYAKHFRNSEILIKKIKEAI